MDFCPRSIPSGSQAVGQGNTMIPQFRPVQTWMYFSVIGSTGGKGQLGGESDGGFHAGETGLILADDAEGGAVEASR